MLKLRVLLLALCLWAGHVTVLQAQPTAFVYQGRLQENGAPANGIYDFRFELYSALNTTLFNTLPITNLAVQVTNGTFNVQLDFGDRFNGADRFLDIGVRTNGSVSFTTLSPRQLITASPYAVRSRTTIHADVATTATNALAVSGANVSGTVPDARLSSNVALLSASQTFTGQNQFKNPSDNGGALRVGAPAAAGPPKQVKFGDADYVTVGEELSDDFLVLRGSRILLLPGAEAVVGIGTTNPTSALEVNGTVKATSFQGNLQAGSLQGTVPVASLPSSAARLDVAQTFTAQKTFAEDIRADGQDIWALNVRATGSSFYGSVARQMVNLFNLSYGIGVQTSTLYQRSESSFAWFKGGVHDNDYLDPGTGGTRLMTLGSGGDLHLSSTSAEVSLQNRSYTNGFVGSPTGGERWSMYVDGATNNGSFRLWSGGDKLTLDKAGKLSVREVSATGSTGIGVYGSAGTIGVLGETTTGYGTFGLASGTGIAIFGQNANATGYAGRFDGRVKVNGNLTVDGDATVSVLTITGGADLAEPFLVREADLPKGSVVVIDSEQAGGLRASSKPYDKCVAGVISGANGINPGLRLSQRGVNETGPDVALTGRVYVRASACNGPIKAGDMLTTSELPGCAMKVTDHARAQGAVLGKAMSMLADGEGMVLCLVTLQ